MKRTRITLLTLLLILLLCACSSKTNTSNVSESISQGASVISKETTSEGKTITTLADGTVIEKASDGSTIEKYSDGTTKEIQANGTVIETAIDGTIIETKIDGTVILTKADGSQIETAPDGSTKEIQAAPEVPTEAVVAAPIVVPPIDAGGTTPIVVPPTEAAVATPIVDTPTESAAAAPIVVLPTQAPVVNTIYELTSAETFLIEAGWSGINSNTSQNVFNQLCIIGDDFSNVKYMETQAIAQIKQIKDSTKPEWWIFESYAQIITAPGKIDCSTTALKKEMIAQLNHNIGSNFGDSQYTRVLYNPTTDTTMIYFVSVSGTTVHN